MRRGDYIFWLCSFLLCFAFVPVAFDGGLEIKLMPLSAPVFELGLIVIGLHRWRQLDDFLFLSAYLAFYLSIFLAVTYGAARITSRWRNRKGVILCRSALIALIIGVSFLPLITYSSIAGSGGTYTFWSAIPRYFEKYGPNLRK